MAHGGEEQARAFYGDTLGLREKKPPKNFSDTVWFDVGGGLELHLFVDDRPPASSRQHLCLAVEDLGAVRSQLERHGCTITETTPTPNRPRFFTSDPFGNRIELTEIRSEYL